MAKILGPLFLLAILVLASVPLHQLPMMLPARGAQEADVAIGREAIVHHEALRPVEKPSEGTSSARAEEALGPKPRPAVYQEGDIVIESGVWMLDGSLELRGNLIVKGDGVAILNETARLFLVQSHNREFGISVLENGRLIIHPGAEITSNCTFDISCADQGQISLEIWAREGEERKMFPDIRLENCDLIVRGSGSLFIKEDIRLRLKGDLIVRGTGAAYLFDMELRMEQDRAHQLKVIVMENGRLILYSGARLVSDYVFDLVCDDYGLVSFEVVKPGVEVALNCSILIRDYGAVVLNEGSILFLGHKGAYENNIVVEGHGNLTCRPGSKLISYFMDTYLTGIPFNITCRDYAQVLLNGSRAFGLYCSGSAKATIVNSSFVRVAISGGELKLGGSRVNRIELMFKGDASGGLSIRPGDVAYWSLATNTTIRGASFTLEIVDSTVLDWSFSIYGSASITIRDSEVGAVLCLNSASAHLQNTIFSWVACHHRSQVHLEGCTGRELACYDHVCAEVRYSELGISVELRGLIGSLSLAGGYVDELTLRAGVELVMIGCQVDFWHLTLLDCPRIYLLDSNLAGLTCLGGTKVQVNCSNIVSLVLGDSSSARISNSSLGSVSCSGSSRLVLLGSTYAHIDVREGARALIYWYLTAIATLLGEPREAANITVYLASNGTEVASGLTGPDGSIGFLLFGEVIVNNTELPAGPYRVVASYGPYAEEELVELTSNSVVRLELGYTLEVRCLDGDGEPVQGLLVEARAGDLVLDATTDLEGWATFDALPAQDITVRAYRWGVLVAELKLVWGANYTGDLVLDAVTCAIYDLRIQVLDEGGNPVAGADVSLVWPNGTGIMTRPTGPGGWAVFENVPAGPYRLKVSKGGYETAWFDVVLSREDQEVTVTLRSAAPPPVSPWLIITAAVGVGLALLVAVSVLIMRKRAVG
mgnify:CR=1 FL=1